MGNTSQAESLAMGIELNKWVVDVETNINNREAEDPAMGTEVKDWVVDINTGVESFSLCDEKKNWAATSIYRVPSFIRDIRERAFTPTVVSFGPYHHNAPRLRPVEEHKRRALIHFLEMARRPLDDFINEMRTIEKQLQDSYHNLDKKWKDPKHPDQFLMLMILDGCFMLEVMRMKDEKHRKRRYAAHDPVFSSYGVNHRLPYIMRDMLVMENQLPLLVLKKLLEVEGLQCEMDDVFINEMILQFFGVKAKTTGLGLHPLDVYRKSLLHGTPPWPPLPPIPSQSFEVLRSAVELRESGVKFRKSNSTSLADIDFQDGVLGLPQITVDDNTESTLLNIVAFEHLHVGTSSEVTSYVCFMDEIIDSAEDVRLLHRKGITRNATGSDESVAELFGSLSKEVTTDPQCRLRYVRQQVNKYCQKKWHNWRAVLRHKYFNTPWSAISLMAAILIILLTAAQTFYSIYQYYHPSGKS
uniref:UPF0481 protein At3g47200 n=1 Tax=Elaeis guineensis var. tenera TaxID=51953 RepID=A0A6I9QI12_ELAGV|nr:UPF0481 protein At3g47200 [Elaeis guineensis]